MLIPQDVRCEAKRRHGSDRVSLSELRRRLARPSTISEAHRQRLSMIVRRAARVRALGDEYAGISVSEHVLAALQTGAEGA